ncbi:MAG: hypothetical protein WA869_25560 [Alloacidobacterium sp.]
MVAVDQLARQLIGDPTFAGPYAVTGVDPGLPLRYGNTYDFRVRLGDHTGGGPAITDTSDAPGPSPIFTMPSVAGSALMPSALKKICR